MTRTSIGRDCKYLLDCIERKRDALGPHADDLRPAIEAARAAVEAEEAEFRAYIAATYPKAAPAVEPVGELYCESRR